jgi:hypothetical protein
MSEAVRRRELGAFLRAHRERVRPADVGLPEGSRRRTPGLRREEVAAMAGVGLAWYTWLEQGRVSASRQVLESVTRVLRLDEDGIRHVLTLAGMLPSRPLDRSDLLAERLTPVLAAWSTSPAALLDRHLDFILWNDAFAALWPDPARVPAARRNLVCVLADDPGLRQALPDWAGLTRSLAQQLRVQAGRHPDDRIQEIDAILHRDHPELAHWWRCRSARDFHGRTVTMDGVGLVFSMFRPAEDPDCLLLLQTPATPADHGRIAGRVRQAAQRTG